MTNKEASGGVRYITTPIYYVNDKPHIGHAYSTIAADVLAHWWRQQGDDVYFQTGTDEHGAKVAESAEKAGKEPKAFCDENGEKFRAVFAALGCSFDRFIRTTDADHERQAVVFVEKLLKSGAVYEGEYEGLYCTQCERFYTEKELLNGLCPDHRIPPQHIKEKNFFFKLSDYAKEVQRRIEANEIEILPTERREEVLGLFKQGMDDFSVSREKVKWGIPFPGSPDQTVYVWVEALMNYVTGLGYVDDRPRFEKYWPTAVHLIGKDILKFHCVYWPALLLAAGEAPPKRIFAHGFFTVNGQKMSKSLGNAIDPLALIETYGVDAVRYLLLTQFPFGSDGDVKQEAFDEKYNADLANGIGNFASRVVTMVQKFSGGEVPVGEVSVETQKMLNRSQGEFSRALENLQFDRALRVVLDAAAFGDGIIEKEKPWELAKNKDARLPGVLTDLLAILASLVAQIAPFMPGTGEKLADALGIDANARTGQWPLPAGRALRPLTPLFPRRQAS